MTLMKQIDDFLLPLRYSKPRRNIWNPPSKTPYPYVAVYRPVGPGPKHDAVFTFGELQVGNNVSDEFSSFDEFKKKWRKLVPLHGLPLDAIQTIDGL